MSVKDSMYQSVQRIVGDMHLMAVSV